MITIHRLDRYGNGDDERALVLARDVEIADGECLWLSGASGAGKSLFLRALADLDPNEGEVELDGVDRDAMPAPVWRRKVTYVAAEPGWWGDVIGDHFADLSVAGGFLERLGFGSNPWDLPISQLSTGERQRVSLVRALSIRPRVLLLDEPTAGLDETATHRVEAIVAEFLADGGSVVLSSHDPAQGVRISSGRLDVEAGTVSRVQRQAAGG